MFPSTAAREAKPDCPELRPMDKCACIAPQAPRTPPGHRNSKQLLRGLPNPCQPRHNAARGLRSFSNLVEKLTQPMMETWDNSGQEATLAYQKTAALTAAIKLDIFTLIGAGAATSEALAEKTGTSSRGMRILCDFLSVAGLLSKEDRSYRVTPSSRRYFDRSSPAWMGSAIDFFAAPEMVHLLLDDPVSYVRRGGSDGLAHLAPNHPIWVRFAKAMTPIARLTAKRAAAHLATRADPPATVLDVGAGHGFYGIELARMLPEVVVTAVDWPSVLELAFANARAVGMADRFRMLAGSAFEVDWGRGFDLVIVANFLHHFSRENCATILRKVRLSLSQKGHACAIDFVPDDNRVSPPVQAMFAFWMLATTPEGDAYTLSDLDEIAKAAGFGRATARLLHPTPQSLVMFEA
jgi:ubiquinone/menaquinone biosynthesis C-methylase UbiE